MGRRVGLPYFKFPTSRHCRKWRQREGREAEGGVPTAGVLTGDGGGSVTPCHSGREAGTSPGHDSRQSAPPHGIPSPGMSRARGHGWAGFSSCDLQGKGPVSCGCRGMAQSAVDTGDRPIGKLINCGSFSTAASLLCKIRDICCYLKTPLGQGKQAQKRGFVWGNQDYGNPK